MVTPGQMPGQQGLQRLQKQQQEMMRRQREMQKQAAWDASRRTVDDSKSQRPGSPREEWAEGPFDRLGFFRRMLRGLFVFAFVIVAAAAALIAAASFVGGYTTDGLVAAAAAVVAMLVMARIRRWGRA